MQISVLQKYIPDNSLPLLKKWFGNHRVHITIAKERSTKLGDYRKLPDGSHKITINDSLAPELFFFVLTHELAHLLTFQEFGYWALPHGKEWKQIYRAMLWESIDIYNYDLRPIILRFSKSPKANFMATPELVKYFYKNNINENETFIEKLSPEAEFIYRESHYKILKPLRKNYLCKNMSTEKIYIFKGLVKVQTVDNEK